MAKYRAFPRFPGLVARATRIFTTEGGDVQAMLKVLDVVLPEHEKLIRDKVAKEKNNG